MAQALKYILRQDDEAMAMKLASFSSRGKQGVGAIVGDRVVDLPKGYRFYMKRKGKVFKQAIPNTMAEFIKCGGQALTAAEKVLGFVEKKEYNVPEIIYELSSVKLLAPVPDPSKIVCTGLNFEDYRKILGLQYLEVPQIFLKAPSSIVGHMDPVEIPHGYGEVYHEYELAAVISQRCRAIPREGVRDVIFGYTILNDITAHSIELKTREYQQWGKSFDTFAPMGPWIVTSNEIEKDLYALKMIRRRNGKVECESSSRYMRFRFDDIISFATTFMTLNPGDVVTSASPPAGPIEPGDMVEAEVERIGVLKNPVAGRDVDLRYARAIGLAPS